MYIKKSPSHSGLTDLFGGESGVYYHLGPTQYHFVNSMYSGGSAFSATTFFSGSTDISLLLTGGSQVRIQNGVNTYTGGTGSAPTVNVVASPSFTSVSATTFVQGGSPISSLFAPISVVPTYVQPGTNITTGGTITRPTVNVVASPSFTTVSATTLFSGSTNLSQVIKSINDNTSFTIVTSSRYTMQSTTENLALFNAGRNATVTLPIAGTVIGRSFLIKDINNFLITVNRQLDDTIEGSLTITTSRGYDYLELMAYQALKWIILRKSF